MSLFSRKKEVKVKRYKLTEESLTALAEEIKKYDSWDWYNDEWEITALTYFLGVADTMPENKTMKRLINQINEALNFKRSLWQVIEWEEVEE